MAQDLGFDQLGGLVVREFHQRSIDDQQDCGLILAIPTRHAMFHHSRLSALQCWPYHVHVVEILPH